MKTSEEWLSEMNETGCPIQVLRQALLEQHKAGMTEAAEICERHEKNQAAYRDFASLAEQSRQDKLAILKARDERVKV